MTPWFHPVFFPSLTLCLDNGGQKKEGEELAGVWKREKKQGMEEEEGTVMPEHSLLVITYD